MPGLGPGIHIFLLAEPKTWMAGSSPAMTPADGLDLNYSAACCGLRASCTSESSATVWIGVKSRCAI